MFSHWVLSDSFVTPGSSVHGQDYWRKLLFPAPGDLPHAEIEFTSLHLLHFSQILYHGVTLANTLDLGKSGICCCVWGGCVLVAQPHALQSSRSSVHGFLRARILGRAAISFSRESLPRDRTRVFHIAGRLFAAWATREAACYHTVNAYTNTILIFFKDWE